MTKDQLKKAAMDYRDLQAMIKELEGEAEVINCLHGDGKHLHTAG